MLVAGIFLSIFYIVIFKAICENLKEEKRKGIFSFLVIVRVIMFIYMYLICEIESPIVDMLLLFALSIIFSIVSSINKVKKITTPTTTPTQNATIQSAPVVESKTNIVPNVDIKCAKCGGLLKVEDNFCQYCGEPFTGDNVVVEQKVYVKPSDFDQIYGFKDKLLVEAFIRKEMTKAGIDLNSKLVPPDILKRRKILNLIFSILVFVYITLIFIHFPLVTYIFGAILLLVFLIVKNKYNLVKYLNKQVESRPQEKISNIVMSVKNSFVVDDTRKVNIISFLAAIIIPLLIFMTPKTIYEKVDGGYAVRYYIFGLTNFRTVTIPDTYKGEKVVGLRGNTFSNMPLLESVALPDSIKEIRGQAFMNCYSLNKVKLPSKLEYLGGGAFYNTKSLKSIELPNTLTYLGGEAFTNSGIEFVSLSNNLEEIRGNTFENCIYLTSINIPDSVTRIGAHAFYGDSSLTTVNIGPDSKLIEIGSSAFRRCYSLNSIKIPSNTSVNSRAFKESPTNIERYGSSLYNN